MAKAKNIIIVSDLHTGSKVALRTNPENKTQETLLKAWKNDIKNFRGKGVDCLICNGDANDGQDKKGMDVDVNDVPWQIEEAEKLIMMWEPKRVIVVEGSAYHTGDTVRYEQFLARSINNVGVDCQFVQKLNTDPINGWFKLQTRHWVSGCALMQSEASAPIRNLMFQMLNSVLESKSENKVAAWPHLTVYSHRHKFVECSLDGGTVMVTPCWKGIGDRFGDTRCDGRVSIGSVRLTIDTTEQGGWSWQRSSYPARIESRRVAVC